MEEALTALLLADDDLAALIGTRVHWGRLPDGVGNWPYIVLQVVSDPSEHDLDGPVDLRQARVQADVYGDDYGQAVAAKRAMLALLSGFRAVAHGVDFRAVFVLDDRDMTDRAAGGERYLFRRMVDLRVTWRPVF